MRFEVRYPSGAHHEVELQGTVAVLGRDPSCDLVLNDVKCSRRHAVLEAGPQGIAVRDSGSANGVYVNGKKVERASLQEGDLVRLGEITLKVLPEDVPGTLVMGPEEMEGLDSGPLQAPGAQPPPPGGPAANPRSRPAPRPAPPAPAPPPPPAPPAPTPLPPAPAAQPPPPPPPPPRPAPPARSAPPQPRAAPTPWPPASTPRGASVGLADAGAMPRPLPVTLLSVLWMLSVLLYGAGGVGLVYFMGTSGWAAAAVIATGAVLAILSGAMAAGLWSRARWAWMLQIAIAVLGLCPALFPSAAVLWYMLRRDVKLQFSGRRNFSPEEVDALRKGSPEALFSALILGGLLFTLLMAGVAAVAVPSLLRARSPSSSAPSSTSSRRA